MTGGQESGVGTDKGAPQICDIAWHLAFMDKCDSPTDIPLRVTLYVADMNAARILWGALHP